MPSIARSKAWFIRVTLPHEILQEKFAQIMSWVDLHSVLFVAHVGDQTEKEHGHMLVRLHSELQKQSLDVRVKSIFHVKGADYSSKPWDLSDSAGSYMFHDPNCFLLGNKGFSDEDIQRYKELNQKTQEVIAVNKSRGMNKNIEAVLEIFQGEKPDRKTILMEFLRRIHKGEMYEPGDFKLKAMTEEVMIKLCTTESQFKSYAYERINNIFR